MASAWMTRRIFANPGMFDQERPITRTTARPLMDRIVYGGYVKMLEHVRLMLGTHGPADQYPNYSMSFSDPDPMTDLFAERQPRLRLVDRIRCREHRLSNHKAQGKNLLVGTRLDNLRIESSQLFF